MSCEEIGDLLPWYLNGSLDEEERRRVERHLEGCASCRQTLEETRFAGAVFAAHLPAEVLVDHAFGRPTAIARNAVERHLDDCEHCAGELELVRAASTREAAVAKGEAETAAADDDAAAMIGEIRVFPPPATTTASSWRPAALAAGLVGAVLAGPLYWSWSESRELRVVIATQEEHVDRLEAARSARAEELAAARERERELRTELERARGGDAPPSGEADAGLAGRLERARAEIERLSLLAASYAAPRLDVKLLELFPAAARRGGEAPPAATLPASTGAATLLLHAPDDLLAGHAAYHRFELELVTPAGALIDRRPGLVYDPGERYFTVHLPQLPQEERFHVVVYGHRGGERVELARYPMVREGS